MMKHTAAARDSVYVLMRTAMGCTPSQADLDLLAQTPGTDIVRFARSNQVLAAFQPVLSVSGIAKALGANVIAILSEAEANRHRNSIIEKQIFELADTFTDAGIARAVVLKGGAFLLEDQPEKASWRYLTDCDVLVEPNDITTAVGGLKKLGYEADDAIYDPASDHHYPTFFRNFDEVPIEIHTRLGPPAAERLLSTAGVLERALSARSDSILAVPALTDRVLHLVNHAQFHSHRYARRQFLLRDAFDFIKLASSSRTGLNPIAGSYGRARDRDQFDAFAGFALQFAPPGRFEWQVTESAQTWMEQTRKASASYYLPYRYLIDDWMRLGFTMLGSAESRANASRTIFNRQRRFKKVADWKAYWKSGGNTR